MIHLIEHLPDPITALTAARHSLCEGGVVLLETPNIESWPARIFGPRWVTLDAPRHMVLFSPQSLTRCLQSAGFEEIRMITYSPSTMEWSESLRYRLNRRRKEGLGNALTIAKVQNHVRESDPDDKKWQRQMLQPVHAAERWSYRLTNFFADALGYGGNILVAAVRRPEQ